MTANGKLLRIEPVTMLLAGFKGSREISEAEKVVSKVLTGFLGSVLLIYDKLRKIKGQLSIFHYLRS